MRQLMRILLINYEFPPLGGGAGKATSHLAREFALRGHDVLVLTSQFRGLPARESMNGVAIERVRTIRRRIDRCTAPEMACFGVAAMGAVMREGVSSFQPEVACAFFGLPSGPAAALLKALRGTPYVVSLRGGDVPGFQPYDLAFYHAVSRPLIRSIWHGAFAVVANSRGLKSRAERSARRKSIELIPNGIEDLGEIGPSPAWPPRVVFTGRLVEQKGLTHLVEAFARLPAAAEAELELIGDGPLRRTLEDQARSLGIADRVRITGWLNRREVLRRLRQARVFALPSLDEGMSNALLEALACGLPAVATAISGNEELIEPDGNGFLVPPGDAAALTECLAVILGDAPRATRMAQCSREIARRYTWPAAADAYLRLFERALGVTSRLKECNAHMTSEPGPRVGSAVA
jgi:glycosyltransferase involved in cell wall biosynthesis